MMVSRDLNHILFGLISNSFLLLRPSVTSTPRLMALLTISISPKQMPKNNINCLFPSLLMSDSIYKTKLRTAVSCP